MKNKTIVSEVVRGYSSNQLGKLIKDYVSKNMPVVVESSTASKRKIDPNTKRLLSYLFTGTRGGTNRLRILLLLAERPLNTHQIAKELDLDYNAIQFHTEVLEKNNMILKAGQRYGALYFLSTFLEHNIEAFNEIVEKLYKSFD